MDYFKLMALGLLTMFLLKLFGFFIGLVFYQISLYLRTKIVEEKIDRRAETYKAFLSFTVMISYRTAMDYALANHLLEQADNERQIFLEDLVANLDNLYTSDETTNEDGV